MMYEECSCVQGIEHFIDPRPYLPQYEGLEQGFMEIPPWMHLHNGCDCGCDIKDVYDTSTSESSTTEDTTTSSTKLEEAKKSKKASRAAFLKVDGNVLLNSCYIYMLAYQVKSSYVYVTSDDDTWKNGNISLIFQNVDSEEQVVVPIELDKYIVIPDKVLTPGKLHISGTCMAKTKNEDYISILTECVEIKVNDPGISQVDWPTKPNYDIYYNYQVTANNLMSDVTKVSNDILGINHDIISLQEENAQLKNTIKDLTIRLERLENK